MKPDYGIDSPALIRNYALAGILFTLCYLLFPYLIPGENHFPMWLFLLIGIVLTTIALFRLLYSTKGKFLHRNELLDMLTWKGDEQVLDIGTGNGNLLIGAATRLTTGKAKGVDLFDPAHHTINTQGVVLQNAQLEGVADKIELFKEDARQLSFENESFDIVLSNLCLHQIPDATGRATACREIYRVLKKGGNALITDIRYIEEYNSNFRSLGCLTFNMEPSYLHLFPPLHILKVSKV
jgi:arsenite methyltransferase